MPGLVSSSVFGSATDLVADCGSRRLQNWFLYFFGALFNSAGLLLVVVIGRQPLNTMFSGLSQVCSWSFLACCPRPGDFIMCALLPSDTTSRNDAVQLLSSSDSLTHQSL